MPREAWRELVAATSHRIYDQALPILLDTHRSAPVSSLNIGMTTAKERFGAGVPVVSGTRATSALTSR